MQIEMEWVKVNLSENELKELEELEKADKNSRNLKKILCIKLKHQGKKHKEISDIINISFDTISKYLKKFKIGGFKELLKSNFKGKPPLLNKEQEEKIFERNKEESFSKTSEAKEFIKENFGINFGLTNVWKILKKN